VEVKTTFLDLGTMKVSEDKFSLLQDKNIGQKPCSRAMFLQAATVFLDRL
jgi:hypothetical protein